MYCTCNSELISHFSYCKLHNEDIAEIQSHTFLEKIRKSNVITKEEITKELQYSSIANGFLGFIYIKVHHLPFI